VGLSNFNLKADLFQDKFHLLKIFFSLFFLFRKTLLTFFRQPDIFTSWLNQEHRYMFFFMKSRGRQTVVSFSFL